MWNVWKSDSKRSYKNNRRTVWEAEDQAKHFSSQDTLIIFYVKRQPNEDGFYGKIPGSKDKIQPASKMMKVGNEVLFVYF